MTPIHRSRQRATAVMMAVLVLTLAACSQDYPNSTFHTNTEFNAAIDHLWNRLLFLGTIVFVLIEGLLIYAVFRYRRRENSPAPKQVHGNATLEILWTAIPALILVFIAVPTVRTIFQTQAKAAPGSLQVEVIGHQWWWEFRYPELGITTANELYIPVGRTVNFELKTHDVLHSFWIPHLGGKRDLISNRTNYLWFTADSSMATKVQNGFCAEFCGESHANMKFRVFTVTPEEFESWAAHQKTPAAFGATVPAAAAAGDVAAAAGAGADSGAAAGGAAATAAAAPAASPAAPTPVMLASAEGYSFPLGDMPGYAVPETPIPASIKRLPAGMTGDAARGQEIYQSTSCIGCHAISGTPFNMSNIGPNLTHVGTRTTIGAGLFRNDAEHMAMWIKNARVMKPGVVMPTLGAGEVDPVTKQVVSSGLSDQQVADIVAYLMALK